MRGFRPLSALSTEERDWIIGFIGHDGVLPLYVDTAFEDLALGINNRLILIGSARRGLILGIAFSGVEAFTIVGELDETELSAACTRPMPAELHVTADLAVRLRPLIGARLEAVRSMRIETCAIGTYTSDPICRIMGPDDAARLTDFYRLYNPRSVFSPWMLKHPFFAVEAQGEILAGAGVLALSRRVGWALIGHFLTQPDRRGRGLAGRLGETLLAALARNGICRAALVTTDDNAAARGVYRRLGFALAEAKVELDLK